MQAYCQRCKTRREVQNPVVTRNPHSKNTLVKGTCGTCGRRIVSFVPGESKS